MTRVILVATLTLFTLLPGCIQPAAQPPREDIAVLFDGMGDHERPVTTTSPSAQRYFNQGLTWAYAFNHDEAIRSFKTAARLDPDCAMAHWGVALCNGPHINNMIVTPQREKAAVEAVKRAQALRDKASLVERALIDAVATRYADPQPADRKPLDEAYAAAMQRVWQAYPNDVDVGSLYAEALMDLQPWDLWNKDGSPKGRVTEIIEVLDAVLAISPNHPGALHLYIHALEGSPTPEKAVAAADRLRDRVPQSGHLQHMPSHIDVQVGNWTKAADQNERAIVADTTYRAIMPTQGLYAGYMAHNAHFLMFACMMEGRRERAVSAAREMLARIPPGFIRDMPQFADPYMGAAIDALKRFGLWDDILREPPPPAGLPISKAMWHFSRGVAYAAKHQLGPAAVEQSAFRAAAKRVPPDALMGANKGVTIMKIADHVLAGEIAFARGEIDAAVRELREAVTIEDTLLYTEPPDWIQPVRHTLGAVLVSAGRHDEAEKVYREDLEHWPENGWSLFGLGKCLRSRGATDEASRIEARLAKAWARADTKIGASCLCVRESN